MTVQVELRGSRPIVTIETYRVILQINYRGVLSIRESRFRNVFPQKLGNSHTKILNLAQ